MTRIIHFSSCLVSLIAAIAVFLVALFAQSGIGNTSYAPIALFGLSIALFVIANYYGLLIRDHWIESERQQRRPRKRIR